MNILITGGCGFIGSHLAEELHQDHDVTIIDNSVKTISNIQDMDVTFINQDITQLDTLKHCFEDIDIVFHEAAMSNVQQSIADSERTYCVNARGTLNVLESARDSNVKKVICASSAAVYGNEPTLPKTENMLSHPESPYAMSKLDGEYYCDQFYKIYGLKTISLRYFNVYGPRQNVQSDYAAVIPIFINKIQSNNQVTIYGDGTQTRDFVYVKDVVQANKIAMYKDITGTFNVASGIQTSINDLYNKISALINPEHDNVLYADQKRGDIKHSYADISSISKNGYKTQYGIESGLLQTINWYIKNNSNVGL